MALDLEAIKARAAEAEMRGGLSCYQVECDLIESDVPALVAEVERMRAANIGTNDVVFSTVEALAQLVCMGGLHQRWRSHRGVCDQCDAVIAVMGRLGFGDRIEEWSAA